VDRWRRSLEAMRATLMEPSPEPWYRRADAWALAATILLPFGWVLAVCRLAWVWAVARRRPRS